MWRREAPWGRRGRRVTAGAAGPSWQPASERARSGAKPPVQPATTAAFAGWPHEQAWRVMEGYEGGELARWRTAATLTATRVPSHEAQ
eukprot:678244-Prymnesium_polylepis.1